MRISFHSFVTSFKFIWVKVTHYALFKSSELNKKIPRKTVLNEGI